MPLVPRTARTHRRRSREDPSRIRRVLLEKGSSRSRLLAIRTAVLRHRRAKVSTKIDVLRALLARVDALAIGGGMAIRSCSPWSEDRARAREPICR